MLADMLRLSSGGLVSMDPVYLVQLRTRFSGWLNVIWLVPGCRYSLNHTVLCGDYSFRRDIACGVQKNLWTSSGRNLLACSVRGNRELVLVTGHVCMFCGECSPTE